MKKHAGYDGCMLAFTLSTTLALSALKVWNMSAKLCQQGSRVLSKGVMRKRRCRSSARMIPCKQQKKNIRWSCPHLSPGMCNLLIGIKLEAVSFVLSTCSRALTISDHMTFAASGGRALCCDALPRGRGVYSPESESPVMNPSETSHSSTAVREAVSTFPD